MDYAGRLARLHARLQGEGLDALYVTNLVNVKYLCGFTGSNGVLLVGGSGARFITDGRYRTQSAEEVAPEVAEVIVYGLPEERQARLRAGVTDFGASQVGFEAEHLTVAALERLQKELEGSELVATEGWVEGLRRVKDEDELALIRAAARIGDAALAFILECVEVGRTEAELALELEMHLRRSGAEDVSFKPIVAAGERSALPHARPSDRLVEKGSFLLFDLGCSYRGYCSDLTRTVVIGPASDRHREVYEMVAAAQASGLRAAAAGRPAAEVDRAAREVIAAAGHAEAFSHGLGHGVGLEIHEAPSLRSTSHDVLETGNVITVEPGAYFAGWGGVRIEDLAVVTGDGLEVLSRAPKELVVL